MKHNTNRIWQPARPGQLLTPDSTIKKTKVLILTLTSLFINLVTVDDGLISDDEGESGDVMKKEPHSKVVTMFYGISPQKDKKIRTPHHEEIESPQQIRVKIEDSSIVFASDFCSGNLA
jgi:hypothetical protein